MKVKVDNFLRAENLGGATMKSPKEGTIVGVKLIPAAELQFGSDSDRYEVRVKVGEEEFDWLCNKTSLKNFVSAFGDESDKWVGQKIKLYAVAQNVRGEMKEVVYGKV